MSVLTRTAPRVLRTAACCLLAGLMLLTATRVGQATTTGTLAYRSVGGVSIDPNGVLTDSTVEERGQLRKLRLELFEQVPQDLAQAVPLRKVSLRALDEAIRQQYKDAKPLPEAMLYLAGLQQIHYVFVYPERNDIVIAGPAEGWKVNAHGDLVGVTTGRPVMLLDDLVVALRSARQAAQGGITCSIDPTSEGVARLRQLVGKLHTIGDPQATKTSIEETLGAQNISVHGVPATSHFARVLVAADYRMKRLAMNFDPSPVRGLTSYLQMVQTSRAGMSNMQPRWWLAPQYQPVLRDAEGLAWQLRVSSVKALAEEDFFAADGTRKDTHRASPAAQKWADMMTAKYDELAVADPVFGELRNCMELAIVAALMAKEDLPTKANCSLPALLEPTGVATAEFPAPRQVSSQASMLKKGTNWVISASGGVQIQAWGAVQHTQSSDVPAGARTKAAPAQPTSWWWN